MRIAITLASALAAVTFAATGCDLEEEPTNGNGGNPAETVDSGFDEEPEAAGCDPSYPDFCIPPIEESGDLDCADVGGPFSVRGSDPHGFDGDGDGLGCEAG